MGRSGDHNVLVLQYTARGVTLLPEAAWISVVVGAITPAPLRGASLRIGGNRTLHHARRG
jgi:hypothetical protein